MNQVNIYLKLSTGIDRIRSINFDDPKNAEKFYVDKFMTLVDQRFRYHKEPFAMNLIIDSEMKKHFKNNKYKELEEQFNATNV